MKQRIRVVGLVQNGASVLIMKKNVGRNDSSPTWELPTGKLKFGEQPEEAIDRTLEEYLGVEETEKIELLENSSQNIILGIDRIINKLDKVLENDGSGNNNN